MPMDIQDVEKEFSVSLSEQSFETYNLDAPSLDLNVTKKGLIKMYKDMVVVRYCIIFILHAAWILSKLTLMV